MQFDAVLPSGWSWSTVDALKASGRSLVSGPFGSNIGSRFFVSSGVPVIRGNNLQTGAVRFIDSGFVFLTEEKASEFPNCVAIEDDLVLTAAGTIGQVGIVPAGCDYPRYIISNKQLRARFDKARVLPLFAYYWLSSREMETYIQSRNTGSTIPLINLSVLRSLPVPLPPLSEQEEIVSVLDALDTRISNLSETSKILEAIAQLIYKSWFVDFDPVNAKAQGREPEGMDAATAALFPSSLNLSASGEVPEGWKVDDLGSRIAVNPTRRLPQGRTATYLDMANVPVMGPTPREVIQREVGSGCKFVNGDTLFAKITPCLENGKTAFVDFLRDGEVAWGSTELIVLSALEPIPPPFAYLLARDAAFRSFAERGMTGTSGRQRVSPEHLKRYKVTYATDDVYRAFGITTEPLFRRIRANADLASTLRQVRDTLLPRLLSGKLRIQKGEKLVASAL